MEQNFKYRLQKYDSIYFPGTQISLKVIDQNLSIKTKIRNG